MSLKYELIGDVVIVKRDLEHADALALMGRLKAKSVVLDRGGIAGELREPTFELLATRDDGAAAEPTHTVHVENGVRYALDVRRVMFSSGNGTERMHFRRHVQASGERVIDMFAGIGYFTLPLMRSTCNGAPRQVIALEKNPVSAAFLRENLRLNGIAELVSAEQQQQQQQEEEAATSGVFVCVGDNRDETLVELLRGTANRVLMGYLPTPREFIATALAYLRADTGILHYHLTALTRASRDETRDEQHARVGALAIDHFTPHLNALARTARVVDVRKVKNYKPKMAHFVVDIVVSEPIQY